MFTPDLLYVKVNVTIKTSWVQIWVEVIRCYKHDKHMRIYNIYAFMFITLIHFDPKVYVGGF